MGDTVVLGRQGRLVIPADVRRRLGLEEGAMLHLQVRGQSLTLSPHASPEQAAQAAHGMLAGRGRGRSLVDELLAERAAQASLER